MHFNSHKWNNLLFEGRNKAYGAFKLRSTSSRRHLFSFLIVVLFLAGVLFLYQWFNSMYFDRLPVIDSAMPPISVAEMEQSLDLQQFAERQPNPVITVQPVAGENMTAVNPNAVENMQNAENQTQDIELDDIIRKTMEEQFTKTVAEQTQINDELDPDKTYLVVDVMPVFPGGKTAMLKFLTATMQYPQDAQRRKVQGQVICSFVVDTDGKVVDIKVEKKVDPVLDREAVRILQQMPQWTPGERLGKPVRVRFSIPIKFGI
ncbi:cell envelope biogenesis protein TonB [Bacteroidia bacterium]|nr:cell envelope biogenesis protein TonB [Bacteroidia bacterium]